MRATISFSMLLFLALSNTVNAQTLPVGTAQNDPLDDRSQSATAPADVSDINAYVVLARAGQSSDQVATVAARVLGPSATTEILFPNVDAANDPEGMARMYRLVAEGRKSPSAQWDLAYRLKDEGGFEESEPDTATAIPDARARQAATAACAADTGVQTPTNQAWSLVEMRVPQSRNLEPKSPGLKFGEGVRICHPDSGWTNHVDLDRSQIDTTASLNLMEGGVDARDPLNYQGHPGHGTGTGSVIISSGGFSGDGEATGPGKVNGIAPKATLVPIRAFKSVIHVFDSDIAKAVRHAERAQCDVISMSLGGAGFFGLKKAIREAVRKDVIVISAAGNCVGQIVAPASYPSVIAVAGTNASGRPWPGTSKGAAIAISAPAEDVFVAKAVTGSSAGAEVRRGNGTSFATAAVAGAAANWLAFHGENAISLAKAGMSRQEFFRLALSTSARKDIPGWDFDEMGAGLLDVHALLSQPLPNANTLATQPAVDDYISDIQHRFGISRGQAEYGLRRVMGGPADFAQRLERFGAEIVDIAMRNPDAFRDAIRPPAPGAFVPPPTLIDDAGSSALRAASRAQTDAP